MMSPDQARLINELTEDAQRDIAYLNLSGAMMQLGMLGIAMTRKRRPFVSSVTLEQRPALSPVKCRMIEAAWTNATPAQREEVLEVLATMSARGLLPPATSSTSLSR